MSKIVIEDIKKDRRSLREVLPSRHGTHHSASDSTHSHHRKIPATSDLATKKYYLDDQCVEEESRLSWLWGAIVLAGVVILIGYFVAPVFTRVTVSVLLKEQTIELDEKISAVRGAAAGEALTFTVMPAIEKTVSMSVAATAERYVETKASGKIIITNNFSDEPQPLVATTRFVSAKGKVYRIAENITVPGIKGGKPGTLEVTVYADKPGPDYNDTLTNFTIPGFADSPKFGKITAKSATSMAGGMTGNIKVVASSTESNIRKQISDQLKTDLVNMIKSQTPDGFFTNEDLIVFSFDINQQTQTAQATNTAVFAGTGRAVAVIFNEADFTSEIISQVMSEDQAKNDIKITNIEDLDIIATPDINTAALNETASLDLQVSGTANLLWQIDKNQLVGKLAGQPKNAFVDVFASYGESIVSGEVVFRPSWSKEFPEEPTRVTIELLTASSQQTP